jgi:hypothetical protein
MNPSDQIMDINDINKILHINLNFTFDECNFTEIYQGTDDEVTWSDYYLERVNSSLGQCHKDNLWMQGMHCMMRYFETLDFPKPSDRNILTPALCKGLTQLQQCWQPIVTACPGEFVTFLDHFIDTLNMTCSLSKIDSMCDIEGILAETSNKYQTGKYSCLDVTLQTVDHLHVYWTGSSSNPLLFSKALHAVISPLEQVLNCSLTIYNLALPEIRHKCTQETVVVLQQVMAGYAWLTHNLLDFIQHFMISLLDDMVVVNGFIKIVKYYYYIFRLAVNYVLHGTLFT